jgi:signal transduction histidine kinase
VVRICIEKDTAVLVVKDDGAGFDPTNVSGGLGLVTMRERAEAIGGELTILSEFKQGTTVAIKVALGGAAR